MRIYKITGVLPNLIIDAKTLAFKVFTKIYNSANLPFFPLSSLRGRLPDHVIMARFRCIIESCPKTLSRKDEVKQHVKRVHQLFNWDWHKAHEGITVFEEDAAGPVRFDHSDCSKEGCADSEMDSAAGRGQREKKPSEKIKELIGKKPDAFADDPERKYPPVYFADHVVVSADVKEVEKIYSHTKVTVEGKPIDIYSLGSQ